MPICNYPKITSFLAISTKRHFWLAVPPARRGSLYYDEGGSMKVKRVISGVLLTLVSFLWMRMRMTMRKRKRERKREMKRGRGRGRREMKRGRGR